MRKTRVITTEQVQNERNHDGAGAKREESRRSRCKTRVITTEQVQNERNHDGAGAKREESRRSRCKTRGITTEQVQNERNHDKAGAKWEESRGSEHCYEKNKKKYILCRTKVAVTQIIKQKAFVCCVFSELKTMWRDPSRQNFHANPNLPKVLPEIVTLAIQTSAKE
jgi:hypothetical protein